MSNKIYPIGVQSFGSLIAVRKQQKVIKNAVCKQQMIVFVFESTKI